MSAVAIVEPHGGGEACQGEPGCIHPSFGRCTDCGEGAFCLMCLGRHQRTCNAYRAAMVRPKAHCSDCTWQWGRLVEACGYHRDQDAVRARTRAWRVQRAVERADRRA